MTARNKCIGNCEGGGSPWPVSSPWSWGFCVCPLLRALCLLSSRAGGKGSLALGLHGPRDGLCQRLLCPEGPLLAPLPSRMAALSLSLPLRDVGGTEVRGRALGQSAWVLSLVPARPGTLGSGHPSVAPVCSCQVGVVTMLGGLGSESRSGPVTSTWVSTRSCSSGNATAATVELPRGPQWESPDPALHEEWPRLALALRSPV